MPNCVDIVKMHAAVNSCERANPLVEKVGDIFRLDGHMNVKSAIFRLRQTEMNGPVKLHC